MSSPAISIITRTKNRALLLERTIMSVLAQTHEDWIHVIVNDGGDPVAVDATAVRLLNENRILSRLPSLDKMTLWLQSASAIDLGKNSEENIELIRIGARPEPPAIFKNSDPPQPEAR